MNMKHSQIKIGCDPEFFCVYPDAQNYDDFIPGGKFVYPPILLEDEHGVTPISVADWKHPLYIASSNGGLETRFVGDGAAMELNFSRPFTSPTEMFDAVHEAKKLLSDWARKFGLEMNDSCVANLDWKRYWQTLVETDERHMMSVIFGCDPDKDAFNVAWDCVIQAAQRHPYRYGGGHIHLSGDPLLAEYPIPAVKLLAITAGNYCMTKASEPELEKMRAMYYGKPGKYRIQNYKDGTVGIEYRTPSNQWTRWNEDDFNGLFRWIDVALDLLNNPAKGLKVIDTFSEITASAIANVDAAMASTVLSALE